MGNLYEKILHEKKERAEETRRSEHAKKLKEEKIVHAKELKRGKIILKSISLIVSSACAIFLFFNKVNQYQDGTVFINFILIEIMLTGIGFIFSSNDGESEVAAAMIPLSIAAGCGYGLWMGCLYSAREYHDAFYGSMTYVISIPMYIIIYGIIGLLGGLLAKVIVDVKIN